MLDVEAKILELMRQQEALDESIVALDAKIEAAHREHECASVQGCDTHCLNLRALYVSLGDELYALGEVTARLDDARVLSSMLDRSRSGYALDMIRLRSEARGSSGGGHSE